METVTLYDANNAVIIVNKADVDGYKAIGFSTKRNEPKKKSSEILKADTKEEAPAEDEKKRAAKK